MADRRFPLRFSPLNRRIMALLGINPGNSYVAVGDTTVDVRLGWGFRARVPRSAIVGAAPAPDVSGIAIGAHGWRGRWLVNGARTGIVRIDMDPPASGHVLVVPIRLRQLLVSADDPDGLGRALRQPG